MFVVIEHILRNYKVNYLVSYFLGNNTKHSNQLKILQNCMLEIQAKLNLMNAMGLTTIDACYASYA